MDPECVKLPGGADNIPPAGFPAKGDGGGVRPSALVAQSPIVCADPWNLRAAIQPSTMAHRQMIRFSPPTLVKFLAGVLLVQAATAIQVVAALSTGDAFSWILFATLSVTSGVFAALWFASIANHRSRETLFKANERFSREREQIRVEAERDKGRLLEKTQARVARATSQIRASGNLKAGAALSGLIGVSAFLLLAQFVSLGLMALTTAGGALAGYAVGRYQNRRLGKGTAAGHLPSKTEPLKAIRADPDAQATLPVSQRESLIRTDWVR